MRVNYSQLALPSAARTATTSQDMRSNRRHTGVLVVLSVTAASGTGGLTLHVRLKDSTSGNYLDLLVDSTPITAIGTYAFELNPADGTPSGGIRVAAARHLAQEWNIQVVHGDGSSYTYSVTATLFVG